MSRKYKQSFYQRKRKDSGITGREYDVRGNLRAKKKGWKGGKMEVNDRTREGKGSTKKQGLGRRCA